MQPAWLLRDYYELPLHHLAHVAPGGAQTRVCQGAVLADHLAAFHTHSARSWRLEVQQLVFHWSSHPSGHCRAMAALGLYDICLAHEEIRALIHHTYIHTYIQAYKHTYIHTCIRATYMHACMRADISICVHEYVRTYAGTEACLYVCLSGIMCMWVCMCMSICLYVYMYETDRSQKLLSTFEL